MLYSNTNLYIGIAKCEGQPHLYHILELKSEGRMLRQYSNKIATETENGFSCDSDGKGG